MNFHEAVQGAIGWCQRHERSAWFVLLAATIVLFLCLAVMNLHPDIVEGVSDSDKIETTVVAVIGLAALILTYPPKMTVSEEGTT